ncbi:MAG TPA: AIR synthase-related protein, partial [Candidatus Saccharimonadales bacterium]|nr:AIR synthase-related protein [Candidatus Saccharimonadales bacterium]
FEFIQERSGLGNLEMFTKFNMGGGLAISSPESEVDRIVEAAKDVGRKAWRAGTIEEGPRQVILKPLNLTLPKELLGIR